MNEYKAKLIRVVDADTCWLDVDLGFRSHQQLEFRLAHIDAASSKTPEGKAASKFVTAWFADCETVIIQTTVGAKGVDKQEKWGRWLAVIRPSTTTETLNDKLVEQGMAVPYEGGKKDSP